MAPKPGATAGKTGPKTGKPSMPEFNKFEELAVAKACLAIGVKPQQPAHLLKAWTAALYAQKLDEVLREHEWVDKPYGKKKDLVWTVDKSKELRPSVTDCWKRWTTGALKVGCMAAGGLC